MHAKKQLCDIADKKSQQYVIDTTYDGDHGAKTEIEKEKIIELFRVALDVEKIKDCHVGDLYQCFEPVSSLEQVAYKRAFGKVLATKREFSIMKGEIGQAEHAVEGQELLEYNKDIGFHCLHYSVTEASGVVQVKIKKEKKGLMRFGVRTVEDTAKAVEDYIPIDEVFEMSVEETTKIVDVKIVNDQGWEPDEDFFIEIYDAEDPQKRKKWGDNTRCKVTILDDDKPGIIGFASREIVSRRKDRVAQVEIVRTDGADGSASVKVENIRIDHGQLAKAYQDFIPYDQTITFGPGETSQIIEIELLPKPEVILEDSKKGITADGPKDDESEEEKEGH
jgi:hypothetical protein